MRWIFGFFSLVDRSFAYVVEALLITVLLAMAGLTLAQVVLRDLFGGGIPGADVISRHMVLWIAFLGGMLGTRSRQHIAIDVLTRMLPRRPRNAVRLVLDGVACVVSLYLAKAALLFVLEEKMMGGIFVGHIPDWWVQAVIPFGFSVIAVEYAIGIFLDIKRILEVGAERHTAGEWRKHLNP